MKQTISFSFIILIFVGAHYAAFIALNKYTEVFRIKNVNLSGVVFSKDISFDQTLTKILQKYKYSLVTLDLVDLKNELKNLIFIESTNISKEYPSTLKIEIIERVPVFEICTEQKRYILDKEGYILPISTNKMLISITIDWSPNITGEQITDDFILDLISTILNEEEIVRVKVMRKDKRLAFFLKDLKSEFCIGGDKLSKKHVEIAMKIRENIQTKKLKVPKKIDVREEKQIALGYM